MHAMNVLNYCKLMYYIICETLQVLQICCPNTCIACVAMDSPKTLCLPVLASFTDSKLLDLFPSNTCITFCYVKSCYHTLLCGSYVCIWCMHCIT